ncbi:MAG: hypothetical protein EHM58_16525 [Ignavibacteriae bacterium]|nr:MAG: hypothetical protein EHM58_16525 [Ignavibacteriota bacterium]
MEKARIVFNGLSDGWIDNAKLVFEFAENSPLKDEFYKIDYIKLANSDLLKGMTICNRYKFTEAYNEYKLNNGVDDGMNEYQFHFSGMKDDTELSFHIWNSTVNGVGSYFEVNCFLESEDEDAELEEGTVRKVDQFFINSIMREVIPELIDKFLAISIHASD